jgi:hypothetical protein
LENGKTHHESTKNGKHEKNLPFYKTPSSFVLSSPAKLKAGKPSTRTAGKFRFFVIVPGL